MPLLVDFSYDAESQASHSPTIPYAVDSFAKDTRTTTTGLMLRPLKEMDVQIEDFHFEYNFRTRSPRIRDDMITYLIPLLS